MQQLCWLPLGVIVLCALPVVVLSSSGIQALKRHSERRTAGGLHVPLLRRQAPTVWKRDGQTGAIGLGDFDDVTYSVLMKIGGIETPVVLDTGSSDLWVISDACSGNCSASVPLYPQATFRSTGLDARLLYGDSSTGTHAFGLVGMDTVGLADFMLQDQYFAAINNTNTSILETGSAGLFGLGFPINSVLWLEVFQHSTGAMNVKRNTLVYSDSPRHSFSQSIHNLAVRWFPKNNIARLSFPTVSSPQNTKKSNSRRQSASIIPEVLASFTSLGPFLSRLVAQGTLASPLFTIALQRDSVDIGGNTGMLSIGELPDGVDNNTLTWAQVRGYPPFAGGLVAPPDSPNELYPVTWEIPLDDVYLDGQKLPRSSLSSPNISLTALIDTGNSLIRGPSDVIQSITNVLGGSGNFLCTDAHSLAFQIGGKMFPVDPRDFVTQAFQHSVAECMSILAATDPPRPGGGGFLYSWSLGDPFLKSVVASFYYGNLSYPSQDPPRIGLLSTVPTGAASDLRSAVAEASANGGNFPITSDPAPSGMAHTSSSSGPRASATSNNSYGAPSVGLSTASLAVILSFSTVVALEIWL